MQRPNPSLEVDVGSAFLIMTPLLDMEALVKNLVVTEEIWKEGNMYVAYCPELDVVSCGRNIEESRKNLLEVIEIHLEETAKLGTLKAFLEEAGYDLDTSQPTLQLDK